jgi:hypothetical protein
MLMSSSINEVLHRVQPPSRMGGISRLGWESRHSRIPSAKTRLLGISKAGDGYLRCLPNLTLS